MTGHSLGAAGVQETIYSLLMLEHQHCANVNIEEMDEQAGLNIITKPTEQKTLTTVMSSSFGFGGTNATLVSRKTRHNRLVIQPVCQKVACGLMRVTEG